MGKNGTATASEQGAGEQGKSASSKMEDKALELEDACTVEDLRLSNRLYLERLAEEVDELLLQYANFVQEQERKNAYGWKGQSVLHVYAQKNKGEQGGVSNLQIQWSRVEFYGTKGNRKAYKRSIKKIINSDNFSFSELKKYAKDWEWPYVEELEKKLGWFRRRASFIAKSNEALRYAIMAEQKYHAIFGEEE